MNIIDFMKLPSVQGIFACALLGLGIEIHSAIFICVGIGLIILSIARGLDD